MHEHLNEWSFVYSAYLVGVIASLVLAGWSWLSLRRAETRRERSRDL
jgi:hypothetical protein